MARLARIVVPDCPHHVTARGNRREPIFFEDGDQDLYCDLLAEQMRKARVEVWAYCLMPNHVHLILCPQTEDGMARALGAAHRRWANFVNARGRWRGHLFDGRFASVVIDEGHLLSAVRYVALNPVRARLAATAVDWPWSSVGAHLAGEDDSLVVVRPVLDRVERFAELIEAAGVGGATTRRSRRSGPRSPLGDRWRPPPSWPILSAGSAVPSPGARPVGSLRRERRTSWNCCEGNGGIVLLSPNYSVSPNYRGGAVAVPPPPLRGPPPPSGTGEVWGVFVLLLFLT